jgi:hypothetical protein
MNSVSASYKGGAMLGGYEPKLNSPDKVWHRPLIQNFTEIRSVVSGVKHAGRQTYKSSFNELHKKQREAKICT